jgi:uncharacterized protein YukE
MAEIIADPDKLRQLANTLLNAAQQLDQQARQLQRSLDSANFGGADGQKFAQDFKQTLRSISQVSARLKNEHARELQKKAQALDQFRS